MPKVIDITVLNIDDKPYAVESLTDEIKALVDVYNDWSHQEAVVRDELSRFHAAKETLSRQIIGQVREHLDAESADLVDNVQVDGKDTVVPEVQVAE